MDGFMYKDPSGWISKCILCQRETVHPEGALHVIKRLCHTLELLSLGHSLFSIRPHMTSPTFFMRGRIGEIASLRGVEWAVGGDRG